MATVIKNLCDGILTGSLVTQYTALTGTRALIKGALVCNTTAGVLALTVQVNPRTAGTARTLISARNIAAGEAYTCPELINQVVEAGGLIIAQGNGLTMMVSGLETTT